MDWLLEMGLDAALLQECHRGLLEDAASKGRLEFSPHPPPGEEHYDRWPMIVRLSDRVGVDWFRQTVPRYSVKEDEVSVHGIGVIEVARLSPVDGTPPFVAASIYARWMHPHPTTNSRWGVGYQDGSVHAAITDLSAFIGHRNPATHRILAAGDFNTIRGATQNNPLALPARDRTIFDRMDALGLELLGPNNPNGRQADPVPYGLRADTQERADLPLDTAVSEDGGESTRLRLCLTRFPQKDSCAGVERSGRMGAERSLPAVDRGG